MINTYRIVMYMGSVERQVDEPIAHPQNCMAECPYGRGRAFCYPCMKKILCERKDSWMTGKA